jgi:hypothetical protein
MIMPNSILNIVAANELTISELQKLLPKVPKKELEQQITKLIQKGKVENSHGKIRLKIDPTVNLYLGYIVLWLEHCNQMTYSELFQRIPNHQHLKQALDLLQTRNLIIAKSPELYSKKQVTHG